MTSPSKDFVLFLMPDDGCDDATIGKRMRQSVEKQETMHIAINQQEFSIIMQVFLKFQSYAVSVESPDSWSGPLAAEVCQRILDKLEHLNGRLFRCLMDALEGYKGG